MGYYDNYLEHHGILGQKWGIRRFQNKDGSLTALGKSRAAEGAEGVSKVLKKGQADARNVRIAGAAKGLAAEAALTVGSSAAGAALGSLTGPAGAYGGMVGGAVGGSLAGKTARAAINQLSNEKAAALSQEYQLLGQKMMDEYGKIKTSELRNEAKSETEKSDKSSSATEDHIRKTAQVDAYGYLEFKSKEKLPVMVNIDKDGGNKDQMIKAAAAATDYMAKKENVSKIKDQVVENMINDNWGDVDNVPKEALKKNLKVYHMYVAGTNGDKVYGEVNCEHRDFFSQDAAPYGDHSIDIEFTYDTKTKKMDLSKNNSING